MKQNFLSFKEKLMSFFKKLWFAVSMFFSVVFVIGILVGSFWVFGHSTSKQIEAEEKTKNPERFVDYDESNEIILDLIHGCLYSKNHGLLAKNETEFDCDKSYITEYKKR